MTTEELTISVLKATPEQKRRIEAALSGHDVQKSEIKDTRLVTIAGTGRLLSVARSTVYALIMSKRLDTVELNGNKRVTMHSVNEFLAGRRPANEKTDAIRSASAARYANSLKR